MFVAAGDDDNLGKRLISGRRRRGERTWLTQYFSTDIAFISTHSFSTHEPSDDQN
jgi:hypothetical protein